MVLIPISRGYPSVIGRLHTRYAPVRRSPSSIATHAAPQLACIKPAASVHPEPGSNSPSYLCFYCLLDFTSYNHFSAITIFATWLVKLQFFFQRTMLLN